MSGIRECYGSCDAGAAECRRCELARYCYSFRENDRKGELGGDGSRARLDAVLAFERYASAPEVYADPVPGGDYAAQAVGRFLGDIVRELDRAGLRLLGLLIDRFHLFAVRHSVEEFQPAQWCRSHVRGLRAALEKYTLLPRFYCRISGAVESTRNTVKTVLRYLLELPKSWKNALKSQFTRNHPDAATVAHDAGCGVGNIYLFNLKKGTIMEKAKKLKAPFVVYILGDLSPSGPNSEFFAAEDELRSRGIEAHNPASCTFLLAFGEGAGLLHDLSRVMLSHSQAALALPGWIKSSEGKLAHHFATVKPMPVFTLEDLATGKIEAYKRKWEKERDAREEGAEAAGEEGEK